MCLFHSAVFLHRFTSSLAIIICHYKIQNFKLWINYVYQLFFPRFFNFYQDLNILFLVI